MLKVSANAYTNRADSCPQSHVETSLHFLGKGKGAQLQAWSGSGDSRKLKFPDFMTTAQDGGKVVSPKHRLPLLTYLLTPWCRVLLEKLTDLQLVKKFPAFYGTRKFITALTSIRHLSLFCASPIQSTYPHPTSWRPILILSTHLRLGVPSGLFPSGFPTKTLYAPSPHPYAPHAQPISFFSILSPAQYWVRTTAHSAPPFLSLRYLNHRILLTSSY